MRIIHDDDNGDKDDDDDNGDEDDVGDVEDIDDDDLTRLFIIDLQRSVGGTVDSQFTLRSAWTPLPWVQAPIATPCPMTVGLKA
ncbi:hypothetical protein PoB_007488700 [Plakobranchus ocellatus]|uniref:Uncharacterized protein n=1 Tax=Plakobranchus ocellatus TaxID=259542 RepID=A0AAV4DWI6_9GAST|nr:hypothetical protein PoB_007488700 [Plakobranchus ocellatus]